MSILSFIKYNNMFPIAISFVLLGAGGVFAATNPEVIFSSTKNVLSIDNTYIAGKDLSSYTPKIEIISVTEDDDYYHAVFKFTTIDLQNHVWQDVVKEQKINVSKMELGKDIDLGLYLTKQLKQIVDRELSYLHEVQAKASKNITQETVATVYSGLLGKFLDSKTETFPGYTPVVLPPTPPSVPKTEEPIPTPPLPDQAEPTPLPNPESTDPVLPEDNNFVDTIPPTIQILGDNPVNLIIGSSYVDLGVAVTDNINQDLEYQIYIDGMLFPSITIDTSTTSTYRIEYSATDEAGNTATAVRTVIVSLPESTAILPDISTTATTTEATATPPPDTVITPPPVDVSTADISTTADNIETNTSTDTPTTTGP